MSMAKRGGSARARGRESGSVRTKVSAMARDCSDGEGVGVSDHRSSVMRSATARATARVRVKDGR